MVTRCAYRLRERPEEDEDPPEDRPLLPDEDRGGGDERTVRPLDPLLREEGAERTVRPLDPLLLLEEGFERTVRPLDPLLLLEEGFERTVPPLDPLLREDPDERTVPRLPEDDEVRDEGDEPTVRPLDPLLPREEGVEPTVRPLDPLLPREEGVEPTVRPLDPLLRAVVVRRVSRTVSVDLPVLERLPCTAVDLPERVERSPETVEAPRVFPTEAFPVLPISRIPPPP